MSGRTGVFIHDIDWLINDAPGLLSGSLTSSLTPTAGAQPIVNSNRFQIKKLALMPTVKRERELRRIMGLVPLHDRQTLHARYLRRDYWPFGFSTCFAEYAGVVMMLNPGLSGKTTQINKNMVEIKRARAEAQRAVDAAHQSWEDAKRSLAMRWVETG